MSNKVSPVEGVSTPEEKSRSSMIGTKTSFIDNGRGQKLYASYWEPDEGKQIRALVFISHGFSEHLQWYEDLAMRLANLGTLAFGHDHVGHGRSEGIRCHVSAFDEYVDDVLKHCDIMRQTHKSLPIFLIGHSMGGLISIRAAMSRPDFFAGLVLMGPLVRPNPEEATPLKIFVAKIIAKFLPYISIGKLNENHVTRDKEMRKKLDDDPLRYRGGFRAQWAIASYKDIVTMGEHLEDVQWPFFVLHGENDRLCDPEASKEFYRKSRSTDKKLKIFPNAFHHLYIETPEVRREALQDTVDWVKDRLSND